MNILTWIALLSIFVMAIIFIGCRKLCIRQFNTAIKQKNSESLKKIVMQKKTAVFVSAYIQDFYLAKAYLMERDMDALKSHLRTMFTKTYNAHDQEQYLTFYFHLFMEEEDMFALELLDRIKQTEMTSLIQYCMWTKDVLMDHTTDLIERMETSINDKEYYGFPLAVITYLVGMQTYYLGNKQEALEWIETARTVFMPNDIYMEKVEKLRDILYKEVMLSNPKEMIDEKASY